MLKMASSQFSLLADVTVCGDTVHSELTDSIAPKGKQRPGYQEHFGHVFHHLNHHLQYRPICQLPHEVSWSHQH